MSLENVSDGGVERRADAEVIAILKEQAWSRVSLAREVARLRVACDQRFQEAEELHAENVKLRVVAEAAKRYVTVLREWDVDKNVVPLPPECASGACGTPPCADGSKPARNEWDHAEAHLVAALGSLESGAAPALPNPHESGA